MYLVQLWDSFAAGTAILFGVFSEAVAISWFYGKYFEHFSISFFSPRYVFHEVIFSS